MARTAQPNSQGSQFFIVLSDSANAALSDPSIKYPYAILGEVTSGMDVVDQIAAMPNSGSPSNSALEPVAMTSVTVSPATAPSASPATSPAGTAPLPSASEAAQP
jgi:cyclophilin family peptidyl-prolyl cis-trans isomerase